MITIARIDERLIHGQVAFAWTTAYKSQAVMAIDDAVAKDAFQKSLLEMACPQGLKCFVVDTAKAVELLKKYENKKIFVVVKHPDVYVKLVQAGIAISSVNVGGLYYKEGRRQISTTVYVDDEMIAAFQQLHEAGVALEVRTHPSDSGSEFMNLL